MKLYKKKLKTENWCAHCTYAFNRNNVIFNQSKCLSYNILYCNFLGLKTQPKH